MKDRLKDLALILALSFACWAMLLGAVYLVIGG